jgi:methionine synthase II (cobalamin-independent)
MKEICKLYLTRADKSWIRWRREVQRLLTEAEVKWMLTSKYMPMCMHTLKSLRKSDTSFADAAEWVRRNKVASDEVDAVNDALIQPKKP